MLDMQTKFVEANGLRFEGEGSGDRLALCLHGFPEHAISWAPDTGAGRNALSRLGDQSARIRAHDPAHASRRLCSAASYGRCDADEINRIIMDELVCSVLKAEAVAYFQRVYLG